MRQKNQFRTPNWLSENFVESVTTLIGQINRYEVHNKKQICRIIGINEKNYRQIMNFKVSPTLRTAQRILDRLQQYYEDYYEDFED